MSKASNTAQPECWHVIEAVRLMELLRRVHEGENPDLVYIEEYVNSERESVEPEEEDA